MILFKNHHEAVPSLSKGVVICHLFHMGVTVVPVLDYLSNVRNFIASGLFEPARF